MVLVEILDVAACVQVDHAGLLQEVVPTCSFFPIGILLQSPFIPFGGFTVFFEGGHILPINDHLSFSFVIWIPGLLKEFLVDIVLHVEFGGGNAVFMLIGGVVGVIGP